MRRLLLGLMAIAFGVTPVFASTITMGTVLPNYAVVSVGADAWFNQNSGPLNGAVLVGDGSKVTSAGGGNGGVTGGLYISGSVASGSDNLSNLQNPATVHLIGSSDGVTAFNDAAALSAAALGLTPTVTLGNISGSRSFTGNGGLNVIDIGTWSSPAVTLSGGANDYFIFNLTSFGTINTAMNIGGVDPSHILWNLTGTSGNIFQTSGGGTEYGTFLATMGGDFQFSNLNLTGELINTGGKIQFVSGSEMTGTPFSPPKTPEPGTLILLGSGFAATGLLRRKVK